MDRFMGMMPSNEVEIEKRYADECDNEISIQAGPHGWSIIYPDMSSYFKDVDDTPNNNFLAAYHRIREKMGVAELVELPSILERGLVHVEMSIGAVSEGRLHKIPSEEIIIADPVAEEPEVPFIRFLWVDSEGTHKIYDTNWPFQFVKDFKNTKVTEIGGFFLMGFPVDVKTLDDAFRICMA